VGNSEDARDVAQEAFIRAYLHLAQLREPEKFGAWMKQITLNECRMWLRRQQEPEAHEVLPVAASETEQVDMRLAVQQALSCLSPESRRTLMLFYIKSYSLQEIAAHLEIPMSTVKSRLRDGRARLRKEMSEMTEAKPEEITLPPLCHRLYREIFEEGKLEVADEIIAPGFVWHNSEVPPGPAGVKMTATAARASFPDLRFVIDDVIEAGDKLIVRWTLHGTQQGEFSGLPATGQTIASTGISIHRVARGKIIELWQQFDEDSVYRQLGFSPPRPPDDPNNNELPINRILTTILQYAINDNVSEILIEPQLIDETVEFEHEGQLITTQTAGTCVVSILYRIDGVLTEQMRVPHFILEPLVERIKTAGRLDFPDSADTSTSYNRIHIEYGQIRLTGDDTECSWTISISPTEFGEKVTLNREPPHESAAS
jgi:steroid delta-isomerase-like uncharacterized protein